MTNMPMNSAALAGVPAGVQSQGVWVGRRQLFVRFAGEAETATMYTAQALVRELERQLSRSSFHSIAIGGRDTLGNVQFEQEKQLSKDIPLPKKRAIFGRSRSKSNMSRISCVKLSTKNTATNLWRCFFFWANGIGRPITRSKSQRNLTRPALGIGK